MTQPRLLDLFCGAGGAAMGYHRAGFAVTGVDLTPRHRYPFMDLVQDDALAVLRDLTYLADFDAIHASPPCPAYSAITRVNPGARDRHPDLVDPVRQLLRASGLPYVIENVEGAPLLSPAMLCGEAFGLGVFRHRLFETNWPLVTPVHAGHAGRVGDGRFFTMTGHGGGTSARTGIAGGSKADWETAIGITWMSKEELAQSIPPAYTQFIGHQLHAHLLLGGPRA